MEFQAPQASHLPLHLPKLAPQAVQVKLAVALAMIVLPMGGASIESRSAGRKEEGAPPPSRAATPPGYFQPR
ncbi:hypothetical protein MASR1M32_24760 [Rhodobacter sp.]